MTVLLVHGDREYLCEPGEELQTDLGVVTVPVDAEPGSTVESHLGEPFRIRRLRGPDFFHHFDRSGAPMLPRDIGLVLGHLGIASGDRVLDVGTGTGVLAAYLGAIGASVVSFEQKTDFAETARKNLEKAGVEDRVEVRDGQVQDYLDDLSGFDAITLDTADASTIVRRGPDLLTAGGGLAIYSPFVEDARSAVEAAREARLADIETYETLQREMDFDDRGSRPATTAVGHTGYLTFCRSD